MSSSIYNGTRLALIAFQKPIAGGDVLWHCQGSASGMCYYDILAMGVEI